MNGDAAPRVDQSDARLGDRLGARLGDRDFRRLAELIEGYCGIRTPPIKRVLVEGRLRKRLRVLGFANYKEYCDYLFHQDGLTEEITSLIDVITTNKTEFFREPKHYEVLMGMVLAELMQAGIGTRRPLRLWSAGCSTGAEAYTLAMLLSDAHMLKPDFDFHILGTDICTDVLRIAQRAVYAEEMIGPVPMSMRKRYLLRSRDSEQQEVRIIPAVRAKVSFRHLNFMEQTYNIGERQDVVFCRNVIIYFDRPVRQAVLERICQHITVGGYLFVGHSEHLGDLTLPIRQAAPTVYIRV
ncbi:MAG: chemotaxis protein CheR [Alphaproteobacteria bacterium]|nr:chemotaxis protein CheR [Alphaproteobacteria bacterium]